MQSLLFILYNNHHGDLPTLYYRNIYYFSRFICYSQYPCIKKRLYFTTKHFKKSKKGELQKVWMQCDKGGVFKTKGFGKREMTIRRDEYLFMIIVTQNNKIKSWSLVIADATHNHPPSLLDTHLIHWQFARIDKVKELIISQTHIEASSK